MNKIKKIGNPFKTLTRLEWCLYITSSLVCFISFACSGFKDILTFIASELGVTSLIFVSKGNVLGQFLTVIFGILYAIISYSQNYYGEMITYLCMTAPAAIIAIISWLRHPYISSSEVQISKITKKQIITLIILAIIGTTIFYFILKALNTANLIVSTISITTSIIPSYLVIIRSPYYGFGYAANDIVLIVLWILSTITDISYLPVVFCFVAFLSMDLYGSINWTRLYKAQSKNLKLEYFRH